MTIPVAGDEAPARDPSANSFVQSALQSSLGRRGIGLQGHSPGYGAHVRIVLDAGNAEGVGTSSNSWVSVASEAFGAASARLNDALSARVALPRIESAAAASTFERIPAGLSAIAAEQGSRAAGGLDPFMDYVSVSLDKVAVEALITSEAVRTVGDALISGAALTLPKVEGLMLRAGVKPAKDGANSKASVPAAPRETLVDSRALRPEEIGGASSLIEPLGLVGLGVAVVNSFGLIDQTQMVALPPVDKVQKDDLPQHYPLPPVKEKGPATNLFRGLIAQEQKSLPRDLYLPNEEASEGPVNRPPIPGGPAQLTEGFLHDEALTLPLLVRLGTVVEILGDRFEAEELEWLRTSRAFDAYLPVSELQAAGIPVSHDLLNSTLPFNAAAAQAAAGGSGGSAADVSADGGSSFSGWRQSLTATASAGFDSNPFLAVTENPQAASLRVQVAPTLSRSGERSTIRLSGRAEHIEYLGKYDSLQNFGADLAASRRVSERFEVNGGLTFSSNILATNLANPFANGDLGPDAPVPPIGNDVTILGQGQRRTQYGANAGLTYVLSERDQLRWSASARADRFGAGGLVESDFFSQQIQYSRQLNEGLTVGAAVDASLINFTGDGRGDSRTLSPQLQVTAALTPRIELSGSAGLAITRLEFGGLEETTTAFAGNVSLCRSGDRSNLCLNGSRQVLPAAIGGALLQTTAGLSYSLRLSERDTLQLSGNYATASQPLAGALGDFESINGFARYERQLDERLRLFVSAGALNTSGNRPTDQTNYQGLVGVTFTLGQSR
jgi:hypothetical protein